MFDLSKLADGVGMLNHHIGVWENFGYHNPPSPDSTKVRPLGQRTAAAITGANAALDDVDALIAELHVIRDQLVREIRQDQDWHRPPAILDHPDDCGCGLGAARCRRLGDRAELIEQTRTEVGP